VVTPKGASSSQDGLRTFRNHLGWCAVLLAAVAVSFVRHYASGAALLWPCTSLLVCAIPIAVWRLGPRLADPTVAGRPFVVAAPAGLPPRPRHAGDITREIPKALLRQLDAEAAAARSVPTQRINLPESTSGPAKP
jgi:hypothetical protein